MSDRLGLSIRYDEALTVGALFFGTVGLYSLDWFNGLPGGISTVGAERVLNGEIPYRDFWTMYAPGHFYLLALLFRVFGTHLLVEVVAASVISAAAGCVCYRLVFNLTERRLEALACASIFLAAMYNTGYFKSLGTYPPAILFVFTALNFIVLHSKFRKPGYLVAAGLATGAAVAFKHDVGGYTAIAIVAGIIAHHFLGQVMAQRQPFQSLLLQLIKYVAGIAAVVLPILAYFGVVAGPDMLRDLIIFPLTDFRFARPERYLSLFPSGIYDEWRLQMLLNLFAYLSFVIPFVLFSLGLAAIWIAIRKGKLTSAAAAVTLAVGFILHYAAAHVQINTHIITMSVYASWLGVILYDVAANAFSTRRPVLSRFLFLIIAVSWLVSLTTSQAYAAWRRPNRTTSELRLGKVSRFMLPPKEARVVEELWSFINNQIPPGQELFVGLHRHDVVITGDIMIYFILDRPPATRYQELHPAIADTGDVQQEIIRDLRRKNIPLIVLKHIFSDEHLETVKKHFLKNLPNIGATDLDDFIREHYVEVRKFGGYAVLKRKDMLVA